MSIFLASSSRKCMIVSTLPAGERFLFKDVNDHHLGLDLLPAYLAPSPSASSTSSLCTSVVSVAMKGG